MTKPSRIIKALNVETLLGIAREGVSPGCIAALADLGLVLDAPATDVPAETWAAAVKCLSADLFPGLPELEATRRLAHVGMQLFVSSPTGMVMQTVSRMLGRERSLLRLTQFFQTGANFLRCELLTLSDGWEVRINDVSGVPGFYLGTLDHRANPARAPRLAELLEWTPPGARYRLYR